MRKAALVAALLLPCAALAQSQIILNSDQSTTLGTIPQIYVGRANCGSMIINFTWDLGTPPSIGQQVNVVHARSVSTCAGSTVTSPDTLTVAPSQMQTGTDQVRASDLILDQSDAGLSGGCSNTVRTSANPWTTYYCVQLTSAATIGFTSPPQFADIPVNFALANPTPPTSVVVGAGDRHLRINWTQGDSAETIASYDVHVTEPDAGVDPARYASHVVAQTSADVSSTDDGKALQDDHTYAVRVRATDSYGNTSDLSPSVPGTPKRILDFYNLYRNEGGSALGGGGCTTGGAAGWIALCALFVGMLARKLGKRGRSRRAKAAAGTSLLALLACFPSSARADEVAPYQRPARRLLVALKADRYSPQVDSEAGLTGAPYHQIFGTRAPLRYQLEADWEVAHPFGSVLLGVTLGFWQNFGKGLALDTRKPSSDTALLDVVPVGLVATYRFDWLADRWERFPLIPYAQAGLSRALWISYAGNGSVSRDTTGGGRGSGWTFGYTTALGAAFSLDALDPELSREAYQDTSIQRTSLFAEYGWTRLDDFHRRGALILSDRAWRFGLALEF